MGTKIFALTEGMIRRNIATITSNVSLSYGHSVVLVNASSSNITVSLPPASTFKGINFVIKKIDSSSNTVTILPQSGQTIDGASSYTLNSQWQKVGIQSNGSNWFVIFN